MLEGGVWRTIAGRRVFIKEGQSLTDAMKESGKFKESGKTNKKDDKKSKIEELERKKEETKDIFEKGRIQTEIDMLKDDFDGTIEEYLAEKQKNNLIKYKKEKEIEIEKKNKEIREQNKILYKNIQVEEIEKSKLTPPKEGYERIYRGLNENFDKFYDRNSIDNTNGYESWTNNYELAKSYGKNVYYMDISKKDIGNDLLTTDGERNYVYSHEKKVGLKGKSGKEYLLYTGHNKYLKSKYTKIKEV